MGTKNYTLEQFGRGDFARDVKRHASAMMLGFARGMKVEAHRHAVKITPLESPDTDGQFMVKRWGHRIGRRDTVPSKPRDGIEQIKLGTSFGVLNDDAGAAAIDAGRKRNHYKNFSRMGGSSQAPRGVSGPLKDHVLNQSERIGKEAIAKADAKFGRR